MPAPKNCPPRYWVSSGLFRYVTHPDLLPPHLRSVCKAAWSVFVDPRRRASQKPWDDIALRAGMPIERVRPLLKELGKLVPPLRDYLNWHWDRFGPAAAHKSGERGA